MQLPQLRGLRTPACHCANATASNACCTLSKRMLQWPAALWLLHSSAAGCEALVTVTGSDWLSSGPGKSTIARPAAASRSMRMSSPESWKMLYGRSLPTNPVQSDEQVAFCMAYNSRIDKHVDCLSILKSVACSIGSSSTE